MVHLAVKVARAFKMGIHQYKSHQRRCCTPDYEDMAHNKWQIYSKRMGTGNETRVSQKRIYMVLQYFVLGLVNGKPFQPQVT